MISLCTFVKNEENCIEHMLQSVKGFYSEFVVVDTGSTDKTLDICRDYDARIYQVGFTDFGKIRTLTAHLARKSWVLMLDADETLSSPELLDGLMKPEIEAYAFPRKRWLDKEMTKQTEIEAYPDYQVRFYRNSHTFVWKRELHEYWHGGSVNNYDTGPIINHFHDVFKDSARLAERQLLYKDLASKANVTIEGGRTLE